MRCATVYQYSLPMEAGVVLRNQRLKTREGLLLKLAQDNCEGWGEISPLPGFSPESLSEASLAVQQALTDWLQGTSLTALIEALEVQCALPSVAFGLSCAQAELQNRLPQQLNTRTAPLCHGDPDALYHRLGGLSDDTESTDPLSVRHCQAKKVAKIKVGLYEAVGDGLNVSMLLEALPNLYLRLDANRSWTPVKAEAFARFVAPELRSRIDFIEEPCTTREQSRAFARHSGIAIAWDESLRETDFVLEAEPGLAAIIIKPTLTGSLAKCQSLIAQAHDLGLQAVISSSIESSLGLTQLARMAAWLTPDMVPGLDTLSLMQGQVVRRWPDSTLPLIVPDQLVAIWQG